MEQAGIRELFDGVVDGVVSDRLHLQGKPEPDIFLQCLARLVSTPVPSQAGIAEDAIAGVAAGRKGGFGLVVGVDRRNDGALRENGANWVINDFSKISANQLISFFADRARAA